MSIEALSTEINWPEREYNHSPPSSDQVTNEWSFNFSALFKVVMCAGITLSLRLEQCVVTELGKL
jgi:hypothetical protein